MFSQADLRAHVVRPAHSMYGAEQAGRNKPWEPVFPRDPM